MEMVDLIAHLENYSKMIRELHSRNGRDDLPKYVSVEEFTFANGKPFGENHALHPDIKRGELKQCFTNASIQFMHLGGEFVYVEGIACGKELGFPVHHAWLVDEDGTVYDPTWEYGPGEALYYGVPFADDYMFETMRREEYYGVLAPSGFFNKKLFEGKDGPDRFLHPFFIDDILQEIEDRAVTK